MLRKGSLLVLSVTGLAALLIAGCDSSQPPAPQAPAAAGKEEEHGHKPGKHGGIIVSIGRDNYHAEAIFEKGGILRLFMLGKDEVSVLEVRTQTLNAYARRVGDTEAVPFTLEADRQPDDAEGKTSQFLGRLPGSLAGQKVEVTIPSLRIEQERFRLAFSNATDQGEAMPAKVADDEERKLYLTPGGKYTEADIAANGRTTASLKFKGTMPSHEAHPVSGDRICPISKTKANPKFTWIIDGKSYQFCCPPCVDEFLQKAKEHPEQVKGPEEYVQK
jgi:hypothetical protein